MILQALADHYEVLVRQGKAEPPGWDKVKISFALCINDQGELERLDITKAQPSQNKKKSAPVPLAFSLPAPVKRSSGIAPNFLWDNATYLLGVDSSGRPRLDRFNACKELHRWLLDSVDSPAARALLAFFDRWDPAKAAEHPALQEDWEELTSSANLVFRYNGTFVQDVPLIRQAWQDYYDADSEGLRMVCLVTGKKEPVEYIHPPIKRVAGAQPSGAALVSFNAPAFCSYGREQNLNAPVSKQAAFAYTAALNYLIADREHSLRIGDTTVLFWAKDGQSLYQSLFLGMLSGETPFYTPGEISEMLGSLLKGNAVQYDETLLDPNMEFYILGIAPNAARLSVRFFLHNTFDRFLNNVQAHQDRLEIIRPAKDRFDFIPLWKLLDATVNQKSRDKSPSPLMAGEILRSILTDTRYPATLLNGVTLRIRAEHQIDRTRAAILKAYYIELAEASRREDPDIPKEVLTVSLNPESTNIPYNMGRLFSVLEAIQEKANPGINATIKDKYFNSASATPSRVFPTLVDLAQKHLRKLNKKLAVFYDRQLAELIGKLGETYPDRLNLPQQGSFQLGYYHQTQARYTKKEENENV